MKEEFKKITDLFALFEKEASLAVYRNNRTAGRRTRKVSLLIERMMKDFRKKSVTEENSVKKKKTPLSEERKREIFIQLSKGKAVKSKSSSKEADMAGKRKKAQTKSSTQTA